MTRYLKPVELDCLPVRQGGEDLLHTHLSIGFPTNTVAESCGACAQLKNDFTWLKFNDAMTGREAEFRDREPVMA